MADIFSSAPGTVAVFPQDYALPGRVRFQGYEPQSFLISGTDMRQSTDQQFQTSLDRDIWIYVFGDQMGEIILRGRAFLAVCSYGSSQSGIGFLEVLDLYSKYRASINPQPVTVTLGPKALSGFLTSMRLMSVVVSEDPIGLVHDFEMTINALPESKPE